MARTRGSRCGRQMWVGSPCTEAAAGGARETTPGSSLERAPIGGWEEARSSAGGFLTPACKAQRTSRGGSSPNNQPPAPPPGPCRPPPCLHICTRPSPRGRGSDCWGLTQPGGDLPAAAGQRPLPNLKEDLLGERPATSSRASPGRCHCVSSFRRHFLKGAKSRFPGRLSPFLLSPRLNERWSQGRGANRALGTGSLLGWGRLPRAEEAPGLSVLAGILSWAQNPKAPLAISPVLRREAQHHGTPVSTTRLAR